MTASEIMQKIAAEWDHLISLKRADDSPEAEQAFNEAMSASRQRYARLWKDLEALADD